MSNDLLNAIKKVSGKDVTANDTLGKTSFDIKLKTGTYRVVYSESIKAIVVGMVLPDDKIIPLAKQTLDKKSPKQGIAQSSSMLLIDDKPIFFSEGFQEVLDDKTLGTILRGMSLVEFIDDQTTLTKIIKEINGTLETL